ncbi:MAG: hypothetical protein ACOYOE_04540 [Chlorobium sp.]
MTAISIKPDNFFLPPPVTNNLEQTSIVQANPSNGIYQILWNVNKLLDKLKQEIKIDDIRLLFENDLRMLRQFGA